MELKKFGWILSESGLKTVDTNANSKTIIATLLNRDLREIGAGISELHKGKLENIDHDLAVLQILKIRNISAPKANENSKTAPKLLKLQLTDGLNTYSAIEMEPTALSLENTPPGTKISLKVKQLKFANSQLLLTPKNMEILGGCVKDLVAKWEISRSLANQMKENRSGGGAPPFTPFGQKIQQNLSNDKSFKSLQQSKQKEQEENSEFNTQRQDAIAEASRAATRKTFGGGQKTLIDSNVQKVMDKGYSEEQAVTALKFARNNAEKALSNLKRREERQQQRAGSNEYESRESHERERRQEKRGTSGKGNADSDPPPAKPSTGVSLFDFLENKIPESTAKQQSNYGHHNERFENNISSSFRKYDKDSTNKSQWSHQYSSNASEQKSSQKYNSNKGSYNSRSDYYQESRDHRSERSERSDRGERSERSERSDRGERNERSDRGERSSYRGGEKQSYYQQQQQAGSNYSSKSHNNNNGSSSHYNRNAAVSNQKPSNVNNGAHQAPHTRENRNSEEKGKYGQKREYDSGRNSGKDYGSSSYNQSSNSYHPKSRSNNSEMYHNKSHQRNVTESMEKMSLKGHQPYKSYDSYESKQQNYSGGSNYMSAGFQSKEANEQAKTALKTKNIPSGPQVSNWQQNQPPPAPTIAQPPTVALQQPIQVLSQSSIKTGPPPFAQAATQMHPFPVMAMPAQPAVFHTYPATPILMQSVPPPPMQQQQPSSNGMLKIGDNCLAKYWEDGKFYNAKITGVSESTYVVLFTEYGNAEEVRKTDCVPMIVPTCPTPPQANFVPQMGTYRIPTQKMHDQQHYHSQSQSMPYKGGPKRRN